MFGNFVDFVTPNVSAGPNSLGSSNPTLTPTWFGQLRIRTALASHLILQHVRTSPDWLRIWLHAFRMKSSASTPLTRRNAERLLSALRIPCTTLHMAATLRSTPVRLLMLPHSLAPRNSSAIACASLRFNVLPSAFLQNFLTTMSPMLQVVRTTPRMTTSAPSVASRLTVCPHSFLPLHASTTLFQSVAITCSPVTHVVPR